MKTFKLPHLLFSLAVIAALVAAAIPAAPAYALTNSASESTSISAADSDSAASAIVCKNIVKWRNGHRIVVRVCHRTHPRPDGQ